MVLFYCLIRFQKRVVRESDTNKKVSDPPSPRLRRTGAIIAKRCTKKTNEPQVQIPNRWQGLLGFKGETA